MNPLASPFDPRALGEFYRRLLLDNILPWWLRHAMDESFGGICSCIRDDGSIVNHDKFVWSQVRALWTFAAAARRVEERPEYRAAADQLFRFCARHGRNAEHDWLFLLTRDGAVKEGPRSIQTDAFAICALVEYALLTGNDEAMLMALESFERTWALIQQPGSYQTAPYPIPPGSKAQRVSMQFSLAYWELAKATGEPRVQQAAWELTDDVLNNFRRPELQACLEYLSLDNRVLPGPIGSYISGGHGIETAWFQIENLRHLGDLTSLNQACDIMRWSFNRGWDEQYGGLRLGGDLHGGPSYLPNGDTKIWWPHAEGLCGALLAYEVCHQPWCLWWHERTLRYALAHFPVPVHGEWTQRLDRYGNRLDQVVALPVKDPFHLPRALVYAVEACARLAS